jgi:hypothetical protein
VWAGAHHGGALLRIDPATNEVEVIPIPRPAVHVGGGGSLRGHGKCRGGSAPLHRRLPDLLGPSRGRGDQAWRRRARLSRVPIQWEELRRW